MRTYCGSNCKVYRGGGSEDFLESIGFDPEEVEALIPDECKVVEEDEIPEVSKTEVTKLGDVWLLGTHRLICGDSLDPATIGTLLNGEKVDLIFTDPPYGLKKEADGIANDNLNYEELLEFNKKWFAVAFEQMKEVGSVYVWGFDEQLMDFYEHIVKPKKGTLFFRNIITWAKGTAMGVGWDGARQYQPETERCLFLMKGAQGFDVSKKKYFDGFEKFRKYFADEFKKTGLPMSELEKLAGATSISHWVAKSEFNFPNKDRYKKLQKALKGDALKADYDAIKADYDAIKADYDAIKAEWYKTRAYFDNAHENMTDVWRINLLQGKEREEAKGHASPKPLALCERAIKTSCPKGGAVLDVFGGSGSTLIACEDTDRICFACELLPMWCDVIVRRWQNRTGLEAVRESDGVTFNTLQSAL